MGSARRFWLKGFSWSCRQTLAGVGGHFKGFVSHRSDAWAGTIQMAGGCNSPRKCVISPCGTSRLVV